MHRIDSYGATAVRPVPRPAGTPGFWQRGNALQQIPATIIDTDWLQAVQDELENPVTAAGLVLDKTNGAQLLRAIRRIASATGNLFTSTQVLTADNAGFASVDASAGSLTLTLPPAGGMSGIPQRLTLCRTDGTANVVTVRCAGSDLFFPSQLTDIRLQQYSRIELTSDGGAHWYLLMQSSEYGGLLALTTTTTLVVPDTVSQMSFEGVAPGGGGGGTDGNQAGGGGGAGGYFRGVVPLTPRQTLVVTIGTEGQGGAAGKDGTSGGTVTVGNWFGATGGYPGLANGQGGAPGQGLGASVNMFGGWGLSAASGNGVGGSGGASFFGGGRRAALPNATLSVGAQGSGGGGGYGSQASVGLSAASGCVLVRWGGNL